jgi:hypothetical protein
MKILEETKVLINHVCFTISGKVKKIFNADTWSQNVGGWIESKDIPFSVAVASNKVN